MGRTFPTPLSELLRSGRACARPDFHFSQFLGSGLSKHFTSGLFQPVRGASGPFSGAGLRYLDSSAFLRARIICSAPGSSRSV